MSLGHKTSWPFRSKTYDVFRRNHENIKVLEQSALVRGSRAALSGQR